MRDLEADPPESVAKERLLRAWDKLIKDLGPAVPPTELDRHRERVLRVPLDRLAIMTFLARELPAWAKRGNRLSLWFEQLYAKYLPEIEPNLRPLGDFRNRDHAELPNPRRRPSGTADVANATF